MWFGTVPGNNRFHEPSIKILQRIAWSIAQTGGPLPQLGPDKSQPEVAGHPILGLNRAAGLDGYVCKKSSTSLLMMSGSSSIFNAVTPEYRGRGTFWIQKNRINK
jgi:hypothetical protein